MKAFRKASRGQVWFLVDPECPREYDGSIQGKNRPWLIVSNDLCNQQSPVLTAVPLTTQSKNNMPTHVQFNDGKCDQTIMCEQIRSIPDRLLFNGGSYYKYTLSQEVMQEVDQALAAQLNITLCFPNAERFWKSLEQTIRFKVEQAVADAKVSPIDISKLSCVIDNHLNELIADVAKPKIPVDSEKAEGFIVDAIPDKVVEISKLTPQQNKRSYQRFTLEEKKQFVDTYYKHGYQYAAKQYNMSQQKAMKNYSRFKKELSENAQTGK